jgi:hypothetical protein
MALKDALESQRNKPCKFATCLARYTDEDLKTLQEWVQQRIAVRQIVNALRAEYPDNNVVEGTFRSHLVGTCCCTGAADPLWGAWA